MKPSSRPSFDPDAPAQPGSGIFGLMDRPDSAGVLLIPVPFDATMSYGGGAAKAPAAILAASRQVDLLDADFGPAYEVRVAMLPIPARISRLSVQARKAAAPVIARGGAR